ncbi:MAG TPA: SDR family oxidoreductase [Candidatus Cybelea sp.]|nr:SDR family oxidoreductase [Candidatus Cybelea sp.]
MTSSQRHILITGATGGIGAETALALAGPDTRLTLVARDPGRLFALGERLRATTASVEPIPADLAAPGAAAEVVAEAEAANGPIDVLVNCAGTNDFRRFAEMAPARIEQLVLTNFLAPMMLTRAALPTMLARGQGRVVNIGSVMGGVGFAGFAVYCATKFGLRGFSEALRRELRGSGVSVVHVAPRYTRTALNTAAMDRMAQAVGMKIDDPKAVARIVAAAVQGRQAEHTIGGAERLLTRVNALFPRLIDFALASLNRRMLRHVAAPERREMAETRS